MFPLVKARSLMPLSICRSIHDEDAPLVADAFYQHLCSDGAETPPNTLKAAAALHLAVKKLRDTGATFERWVPFIHLGI